MDKHPWEIFDPQTVLANALSAERQAAVARKLALNAAGRTTFTGHLTHEAGMRAALVVTLRSLDAGFNQRCDEYDARSANDPYMQGMRDGLLFASAAVSTLATQVGQLPSKWGSAT